MQLFSKISRLLRIQYCALLALTLIASGAATTDAAAVQDGRYAPSQFGIPDTIGEYTVLAALTEDNFVCMGPGERRLILQSSKASIEDALRVFPKDRKELVRWTSIIVGPGAKREQLAEYFDRSGQIFKARVCPTLNLPNPINPALAAPPADSQCSLINKKLNTDGVIVEGEWRCQGGGGFAIIQNLDVGTYPNAVAQTVNLIAPDFRDAGTYRWRACPLTVVYCSSFTGGYSALLNNVMTDGNYFMQVGLYFTRRDDPLNPLNKGNPPQADCPGLPPPDPGNPFSPNGVGWVVYAGAQIQPGVSADLSAHALCVPFVAGHQYYTTATYTNNVWWTCAADLADTSTYRCVQQSKAKGTHLVKHEGTSIFFENYNRDADRPWGFPYQLEVYGARTHVPGKPAPLPWSNQGQAIWTKHSCKDTSWPANGAIGESLANDGMAFFNVSGLPPDCE